MSEFMQGSPDNSVAVPFSDDDTEAKKVTDLEEEDSPTASPEERRTRRERRKERMQLMLQESRQNAERVKELEDRGNKTARELAELRGMLAAQQQLQTRIANDNGKDPYEQRLDEVYARQKRAYDAAQAEIAAGKLTPERQAYYEQEAREIETAKTRIHTERAVSGAIAQDRETRRTEQAQQVWVQKYPDVYNNPAAFEYAQGTWQRRKAQAAARGETLSNDAVDEVMLETMNEFKLGKRPAPSASDRAKLAGIPSSGGGGGGKAPTGINFDSNPALKRMALAAHSDLPEAEALKKWTNSTGKRLRDKKVI